MEIKFYALGQNVPCMRIMSFGIDNGAWGRMCEMLVDYALGEDPYSEADASDLVDVVAMESTDGEEYTEAVYVKGKLIGSLGDPFWYPLNEYQKI